jgi:Patatin-like phospholipase
MRRKIIIVSILIVFLGTIMLIKMIRPKFTESQSSQKRNGVAILLTGAAARIPQEAALLEELDNRGLLKNVVFISGVSSGALNSAILNGILDHKMTWDGYKNILYNLKTSDIYFQDGKKIPVNTDPARELYRQIVEDNLGYKQIGDLPIVTSISVTHPESIILNHPVYRMCSIKINEESDTTLSLVDVLMASSAFPMVFPGVHINNVKTIPDFSYMDGGIGEDHVPFHALLDFEKFRGVGVEKVYIISRKSDSIPEVSEELKGIGINDKGIFDKLGISIDDVLKRGINKRLKAFAEEAPDLIDKTQVWIPDFEANFLLFDFNDLRKQYELTSNWAKSHDPVPLKEYLALIE